MGIPRDIVESFHWRVDDGEIHTCDFRIINGVKYVPERTCELEEPDSFEPMNMMTCSKCGMKTLVANFCSWCGAKVVE